MKLTTAVLILGALLITTCDSSMFAQKKETKKGAAQTASTIKEVLAQYLDKATNLGTLKRVTGDYFVMEEDGNMVVHPLSTLHTIKVIKAEEGGEMKIEIKLVAKD